MGGFDPSKYGAVPVKDSGFDPSSYGAVPVHQDSQLSIPTAQLQQAAAQSAPSVMGAPGVIGQALKAAWGMATGALPAMVTGMYGEPNPAVAGPLASVVNAPEKTVAGKIAATAIPFAQPALSLADLGSRLAGRAPLLNESLQQAQGNVAQGAGQLAM